MVQVLTTRMHSSRIRTAHLLTVSHSILCIRGGLPNPLDADPLPPGRRAPYPQMQTPLVM